MSCLKVVYLCSSCLKKNTQLFLCNRVVNELTRSGPNPAKTRKCKPEPENNLGL